MLVLVRVGEGHIVGVVSRSDIVHLLARGDERLRAEVIAGAVPGVMTVRFRG